MQCRRAEMVIYGIAKFLSLSVQAAVTLIVFFWHTGCRIFTPYYMANEDDIVDVDKGMQQRF